MSIQRRHPRLSNRQRNIQRIESLQSSNLKHVFPPCSDTQSQSMISTMVFISPSPTPAYDPEAVMEIQNKSKKAISAPGLSEADRDDWNPYSVKTRNCQEVPPLLMPQWHSETVFGTEWFIYLQLEEQLFTNGRRNNEWDNHRPKKERWGNEHFWASMIHFLCVTATQAPQDQIRS